MRKFYIVVILMFLSQLTFAQDNAATIGISFCDTNAGMSMGYYRLNWEESKIGYFINCTVDITPQGDYEHQSEPWFYWHTVIDEKTDNYVVNGGLTLTPVKAFTLYGGVGLVAHQQMLHYASTVSDLDYWVYSDMEPNINFNIGGMLRPIDKFAFDFGYNTGSKEIYLGLGFVY